MAMAEALNGKGGELVLKYIDRLHYMIFRALDDIKETVRSPYFALCMVFCFLSSPSLLLLFVY